MDVIALMYVYYTHYYQTRHAVIITFETIKFICSYSFDFYQWLQTTLPADGYITKKCVCERKRQRALGLGFNLERLQVRQDYAAVWSLPWPSPHGISAYVWTDSNGRPSANNTHNNQKSAVQTCRCLYTETWPKPRTSSKSGLRWRCFPTTPPSTSNPTAQGSVRPGPSNCSPDPNIRSRWWWNPERSKPRRSLFVFVERDENPMVQIESQRRSRFGHLIFRWFFFFKLTQISKTMNHTLSIES